ncbi:MAG: xanthine dehydrogenase family protein subunit M [Actinobacteria bacterium]|nr:MAG: xanthine dehydrogenase family protein subunit M [Actinomycetota bacterium]
MEMFRPRSVEEAVNILSGHPEATILAGGTDLMIEVNARRATPSAVVSLRGVGELRAWDGNRIGACVTYDRLQAGPQPALAQAARTVGSPQIRNAGTIGGNVATASPAGDTLPFLAAVGASVEVASLAGRRSVPIADFITGVKRTALLPGELITAIVLPDGLPETQAFAKVGVRDAMVIAIVSACVVRWPDGTTRVALGAAGPVPVRPRRAEELVSAAPELSPSMLAAFAALVAEDASPITDHRGTEGYRRHAAGVLARRLLERLL